MPLASGDICGQGPEDPTVGGPNGYAEVYLAPDLISGPTHSGCGDITTPADRGGYSAIVAVHELIHTFGALDTTSKPGPPHACPDSSCARVPGQPARHHGAAGTTYWIDDTFLDFGNDDYYGMPASDTWWDVQDSVWLRHLNAPTYTLDISPGAGRRVDDERSPRGGLHGALHVDWDADTSVTLTATPHPGYSHVVWGGACAGRCGAHRLHARMTANQGVSVSFLKALAVTSFTAPRQVGKRLRVEVAAEPRPGRARSEHRVPCHHGAEARRARDRP